MVPTTDQMTFAVASDWLAELADYAETSPSPHQLRGIDVKMLRRIAELLRGDSCLIKSASDEPRFTLLGRDPDAVLSVRYWAAQRANRCGETDDVLEAYQIADAMDAYRERKRPV